MARHTGASGVSAGADGVLTRAAVHDLANLVQAAMRSAAAARCAPGVASANQLASLEVALAQMGDLLALVTPAGRVRGARDAGLSVHDAVVHAAQLMEAEANERGVRVRADADAQLLSWAMPGLFRALADAVRNSLEALEGQDGGEIVMGARRVGSEVVVEVTDNGPGPSGAKAGGRGGLGLAVAQRVAERVGGTAELEGRAGACVWRVRAPVERLTPTGAAA